ncbi:MAG TPA: SRPBCC domain-containing protein [Candidatus Limnocylindria bacterium]|jgi:carbon monoxide dehydrogenase subunit G|nr:SRPBCC domain-containing protein [Candidatus Limnocylindria bacterium]
MDVSAVVAVVFLVLTAALLTVIAVGRSLPVAHVASRSETLPAPPKRVWDAINDPQLLRSRGVGDVKFETVESVPPRRLVRRVVGENDFGGTWTCELEPDSAGTRLVITENGEIYNAFFRFVSRYIIGHHRTIDSFMAALRRYLEASPA